jgi:short-subunit dehydrogenase
MSSPLYSIYNATKWALEGFLESLHYELRQFDIRIKIIEPGPANTDFYGRSQQVIHNESLHVYDDYVNLVVPNLQQVGVEGCGPEVIAETIYKAAIDRGARLRYPSGNGTAFWLWLRGKIPTHWFVKIVTRKFEKASDRLARYRPKD